MFFKENGLLGDIKVVCLLHTGLIKMVIYIKLKAMGFRRFIGPSNRLVGLLVV